MLHLLLPQMQAALTEMRFPGMLCVALPVTVGLVFRWVGSLTGRPMLGAEVSEGEGEREERARDARNDRYMTMTILFRSDNNQCSSKTRHCFTFFLFSMGDMACTLLVTLFFMAGGCSGSCTYLHVAKPSNVGGELLREAR